ncbi:MAG: hypothetical protein ACI4K8_04130 [Candidatus Fimenecus sp.]
MSCILTLASAAIIAGLSMSTATSLAVLGNFSEGKENIEEGIETMFADSAILLQTLQEYGCCVETVSENEYVVQTNCGRLRYKRENAAQGFKLYLDEIADVEGLLENIRSFESDYGRNVQAYTYNHIKENMTDDMTITEETVLEDNSMLLTISVS